MSQRSPQSVRVRQIVFNPEHVEPLPAAGSDAVRFFAAAAGNARHPASIMGITSVIVRMIILPGFSTHESSTLCHFMIILSPIAPASRGAMRDATSGHIPVRNCLFGVPGSAVLLINGRSIRRHPNCSALVRKARQAAQPTTQTYDFRTAPSVRAWSPVPPLRSGGPPWSRQCRPWWRPSSPQRR